MYILTGFSFFEGVTRILRQGGTASSWGLGAVVSSQWGPGEKPLVADKGYVPPGYVPAYRYLYNIVKYSVVYKAIAIAFYTLICHCICYIRHTMSLYVFKRDIYYITSPRYTLAC